MKEIIVDGVTYLPASTLAKDFKYTSDYIGQLCRAKKVDAQLVGRSWYVNPLSLQSLRTKRYSRKGTGKKTEAPVDEEAFSIPVRVNSPLAKTTVKQQEGLRTPQNYIKRIDWKPLKYEDDSAELLPALGKSSRAVSLRVDLAESSDIAIKSSSKSTSLVPEELPTVSLKGRINIVSLEEGFDVDTDSVIEDVVSFDEVLPASLVPEEVSISKVPHVNRRFSQNSPVTVSPAQVKIPSSDNEAGDRAWTFGELFFLVIDFVLIVVLLLIAFLTAQVEISQGLYLQEFLFSGDDVVDLFSCYFF